MKNKNAELIQNLLEGRTENHLMPFFWQHGEDEATLREYMGVIQKANCGGSFVESRPASRTSAVRSGGMTWILFWKKHVNAG